MPSKLTEKDIKDFVRKVDELHAKLPTLDDYLLLEVFLSENREKLNRREANSARMVAEHVMARWRKQTDLKSALERGNRMDCGSLGSLTCYFPADVDQRPVSRVTGQLPARVGLLIHLLKPTEFRS